MNGKRILLIAAGLSFIGIIPKFLKNPVDDWKMPVLYFLYIGICFLSFYAVNRFLWVTKSQVSNGIKFGIGFACGFILLSFSHLLLLNTWRNVLVYFLNLKEINVCNILSITAFRAIIIQSIAFACLSFFKNRQEKKIFWEEIDHLNKYLDGLRNNQAMPKTYKDTLITRFQDKVIPVDVSDIAFFHLSNGVVYQYLSDSRKYIQNATLESLEKDLDPHIFYRANRQFLINRKAVEKVEQIENRKLKVLLTQTQPEDVIISKAKSSAFIKWLEA